MTETELRRASLLARVALYWRDHGYAPLHRELTGPDTYAASTGIARNLRVLAWQGYIRFTNDYLRNVRLTEKGEALCQ